jgi:phasin
MPPAFQPAENRLFFDPKRYFMTATNNPQAAAGQASAAYRSMTDKLGHLGLDTAVPEGVRALAEKAVAHTREAYDRSKDAFDASLTTFERSFDAAGQGAAAFNRKIVDIARRNVDANFDLATSLAGAKNLTDIVELQSAFWREQFGVLTSQAEEVRALSAKVTADAAEPIKSQMARGDGRSR